jgi:hypothetical protein
LVTRPLVGEPATRRFFALVRAGTQQDPGVAAVLAVLRDVAAARPDGVAVTAPELRRRTHEDAHGR